MDPAQLTTRLTQQARILGFDLCGACPAVSPPGAARLGDWLQRGYAGEMNYLSDRRRAYDHPRHVLEGVQSIFVLAMHYRTVEPTEPQPGQARVSRYAWGDGDYHDVIRERLHVLADHLRELAPSAATRCVVDTAPLLEREFAEMAGLGWIGKNTLLLSKEAGSYFFLAAVLTDQLLDFNTTSQTDHCGTCTACLDACPTEAFAAPYVLDASRCISYLTIEHRSAIPRELRTEMGDWAFGCDVCQEVCPWNRHAPLSQVAEFRPLGANDPLDLCGLFQLSETEFRQRFRHTPLWRPHRRGLLRNAAIVLGNQKDETALPALTTGLADEEPLVRGACAWALGQFDADSARRALQVRQGIEDDPGVLQEIDAVLTAG